MWLFVVGRSKSSSSGVSIKNCGNSILGNFPKINAVVGYTGLVLRTIPEASQHEG